VLATVCYYAADGAHRTVGTGAGALSTLTDLGVSLGAEPRALVLPDRDTLSRLLGLAMEADPSSADAGAAAGTGAVLNVTAACSARWVLGVPPEHERDLALWRTGLGVTERGPRAACCSWP
jgi:hypothetical protein